MVEKSGSLLLDSLGELVGIKIKRFISKALLFIRGKSTLHK
jgi:hypothetical protein